MDWCGAVAVLQKYIVYCIIYCVAVVSLEVSKSNIYKKMDDIKYCLSFPSSLWLLTGIFSGMCAGRQSLLLSSGNSLS